MTIDPLERGARALAIAYDFQPDHSWSDQAFDAAPAMAPPEVPQELPAWAHFKGVATEALQKCTNEDAHVTCAGSEDERIFGALSTAGLVRVVLVDEGRKEWALTEAGEATVRQAPTP